MKRRTAPPSRRLQIDPGTYLQAVVRDVAGSISGSVTDTDGNVLTADLDDDGTAEAQSLTLRATRSPEKGKRSRREAVLWSRLSNPVGDLQGRICFTV